MARNEVTLSLRRAKASHFAKMFQEVKKTSAYLNLLNEDTCPKVHTKNIGPLKRYDGAPCAC